MGIGMWRRGWSRRMGVEGLGAAVGGRNGIGYAEKNFLRHKTCWLSAGAAFL